MFAYFYILPTRPVSEDFFLQCWDDDTINLLLEAYDAGRVIHVLEVPVYIASVSLSALDGEPVEFLCRYVAGEQNTHRPKRTH